MSRASFLSRVPGFRSGVRWKKILATAFYVFLGMGLLGQCFGTYLDTDLKSARDYVQQTKFDLGILKYESILEKWDQYKDPAVQKTAVEHELAEARNAYASVLSSEALAQVATGDLQEAGQLVAKALEQVQDSADAQAASEALAQATARKDADALLAQADASLRAGDIERAIEYVSSAAEKAGDYDRVIQMRADLREELWDKAGDYLMDASSHLFSWELDEAKTDLDKAASLAPDHPDLPGMRSNLAERETTVVELGPKPENSLWDGSVAEVKNYLSQILNDPYSVKYEEWSPVTMVTYQGTEYWGVRVKFRAKNAFGAYVLAEKLALIRQGWIKMIDY